MSAPDQTFEEIVDEHFDNGCDECQSSKDGHFHELDLRTPQSQFTHKVTHPAGTVDPETGKPAAPETERLTHMDAIEYAEWCQARGINAEVVPA